MSIQEHLNKIRNAVFGSEVRESIAKGIETAYNDASEKDNANMEVKMARGTNPNLNARLNKMEETDQQTTAQLQQKVDKTATDLGINMFNEADRAVLQGMEVGQINAVLGRRNVRPENTAFFERGTNLFNKSEAVSGYYLNGTTGETVSGDGWGLSGSIDVLGLDEVILAHAWHYVLYDKSGERITGGTVPADKRDNFVVTIGSAETLRFSWHLLSKQMDAQQVNVGNQLLPYEPYREYIPKKYNDRLSGTDIENGSISEEKLTFITDGENKFNPAKATKGAYINQGNLVQADGWTVSDYIDVSATDSVNIRHAWQYSLFNASGVHQSGVTSIPAKDYVVVDTQNASFIRFSWHDMSLPLENQQLTFGEEAKAFVPYSKKLDPAIFPEYEKEKKKAEITLPKKLYALVGEELNIYFDNVINDKVTRYDFDVECTIGAHYEEYYRVRPQTAGTYPITVKVIKDDQEVAFASSTIIVTAKMVGDGQTRNVLIVGDSTTAGGEVVTKLHENLTNDVFSVSTIGTRGTSPNNHEGRSGWTALQYTTIGQDAIIPTLKNAFWNPNTSKFDFTYYMAQNGLPRPDYFILNLGINDVFLYATDETLRGRIEQFIAQYDEMIASVHSYDPTIKIGIALTIPPQFSQDSFGRSYNSNQTRWRYKLNNFILVKRLLDTYEGRETENIHLIPINTNLDTRHNFPIDLALPSVPVNARNTSVTVPNLATNAGVHPAMPGYWQIADVYWYWLKSFEI